MADDGEATLVTPRFDEEEITVAQPVVPLGVVGRVASLRPSSLRPRVLALVLVSALAGVVLGGAGIYFYQSRSSAIAAAPEPSNVPAEVAQPQPAPMTEAANDSPPQQQSDAPATDDDVKDAATATVAPAREAGSKKESARESARESAPAKRKASDDEGASVGVARRGKKGEDDAVTQSEGRPRRAVYDTQGPIPEDSPQAERRARRVEAGLRRAERVRERQRRRRDNAARSQGGSIEGIFEGQPR